MPCPQQGQATRDKPQRQTSLPGLEFRPQPVGNPYLPSALCRRWTAPGTGPADFMLVGLFIRCTLMIAIRPPEYFPRPSYVALMQHADTFVVADTFQYSRQSFHNRTKLRNPNGWQWITVPLKSYGHQEAIRDVPIDHHDRWQERHWRSFMYNYRSTMYFEFFEDRFRPVFEEAEWKKLGALTRRTVDIMAQLLGIDTPLVFASNLPEAPDSVARVIEALDDDAPPLLVPEATAAIDAGAADDVQVLTFDLPSYRQNFEGFEAEMSAMDLAFNYGPESGRMIADASTVRPLQTRGPASSSNS